MSVPNYYTRLPKQFLDNNQISYPNYNQIKITLPFQMLIVGKTGSGKSNALIHLINSIGAFSKFILLIKNTEEPLYKYMIQTLRDIEEEYDDEDKILFVTTDPNELPDLSEMQAEDGSTLLIADDMVTESAKDQKKIVEAWIRGRKQGISCVYLSQSYFQIPKVIRENSSIIILKSIVSIPEVKRIMKEYSLSEDPKKIIKVYDKIQSTDKMNFMMIDKSAIDPNLRYRYNFKGIPIDVLSR
jgi:hypothetical protein